MTRTPSFLLIGLGTVGRAVLPILRASWPMSEIVAIDQDLDDRKSMAAQQFRLRAIEMRIDQDNYRTVLAPLLRPETVVLNLAFEVCSLDVIELAQSCGANYLDTCIDPWPCGLADGETDVTTDALRESLLDFGRTRRRGPTALVAHGANPGFVSTLALRAIDLMRREFLPDLRERPSDRYSWALLACQLGIRVIQIAERDSQRSTPPGPGELVNTWSVESFVAECRQPAELGLGSHETLGAPQERLHGTGNSIGTSLAQPGFRTRVRSWCPSTGEFEAWLISHNEALSIADFLTCGDREHPAYRPTVYFAYRPSAEAMLSMASLGDQPISATHRKRIAIDEIPDGMDELGVLLISDRFRSLWLGSQLSIEQARRTVAGSNATSLQVASSVVAAIAWIVAHPDQGVVESEALDHELLYEQVRPYWEPLTEHYTAWPHDEQSRRLRLDDLIIQTP